MRDSGRKQALSFWEFRERFGSVDREDFHLWSIYAVIGLALTAGLAAVVLPNLHFGFERIEGRYLPQVLFGLMVLIVLFNAYVFQQRRKFRWTREELINQLMRGEVAEQLILIDPLTETYNRRYLEQVLSKETSRADRRGTSLSVVMIDVDDFKSVNTRFGHQTGDLILCELARLLKNTFRGSDSIARYGGDEFLLVLPETEEHEASAAVKRLLSRLPEWNAENKVPGYEMRLSYGVATYKRGATMTEVIEAADHRMYEMKDRT